MNRPRLIVAALAGLLGYAALAILPRHVPPLPAAGFSLDRSAAIRRAREITTDLGVDTVAWHSVATSGQDRRLQFWQHRHARDPIDLLLTPLNVSVQLASPTGAGQFHLKMNADGGACEIRQTGSERRMEPGAAKALADRVFHLMAGKHAGRFRLATDGAAVRDETQYGWEADSSQPDQLSWSAKVTIGPTGLREASVSPVFGPPAVEEYNHSKSLLDAVSVISAVFVAVLALASIGIFLYNWLRGSIERGASLGLALLMTAGMILANTLGSDGQQYLYSQEARTLSFLGILFVILVFPAGVAALFGAGEAIGSRKSDSVQWFPFLLALRGHLRSRQVGLSLAVGLLFGGALAALPFAAAAISPTDLEWQQPAIAALVSPSPILEPVLPPFSIGWVALFCFLLPVLDHRVRQFRGKSIPVLIVVIVGSAAASPYFTGTAAAALWSVLFGIICFGLYRRYDLLVLFAALGSAKVAEQCAALLATASDTLISSAHNNVGVTVALFLASLVVAVRGPEMGLEKSDESDIEPVSQRERLMSEVSLAREAQQRMLPLEPPGLQGFDLAGICYPAREVGGDLYDYTRLADGRWAICVADVSGKGMSAALYMTLTKGLLTACAQDSDDVCEIASQMNTHIYAVGRRKVFVTAALGAIDQRTGVVEYVRAGHNPIVWHSPSRGFTRLVQPRGIGLGVAPSSIFDRTLEAERLQLSAGDALVFYSDGITEAMNAKQEQFGEERLMAAVAAARGATAHSLRERVLEDVTLFLEGQPAQDDVTVLVLRAGDSDGARSQGLAEAATLGHHSSQLGERTIG